MDAFVITFREGLEAAVAVGVIAGYLVVMGQKPLMKWVYAGVVAAVLASLAGGIALRGAADVVENPAFEGVVYLTAAVFVTSMVVWMWRTGRKAAGKIRERVDATVSIEHYGWRAFGLFLVSFLLVGREGIETALFLVASSLGEASSSSLVIGGILGIVAALGIAFLIIKGSEKVDLKLFFGATSVVLVVLAVRFFAAGIAELGEAGILPISHAVEEALEVVSHGLGNPWVMGLLVLVPVGAIGWALLKKRGDHAGLKPS
jgi:high-affinity iron transporter